MYPKTPYRFLLAFALLITSSGVFAEWNGNPNFEEEPEKPWVESEVILPPVPLRDSLVAFEPSPTSRNRFYIDPASISLQEEGVVRYTLWIETSGGAKNVSYEGMRCSTREMRPYAFLRADGSWVKSKSDTWRSTYNLGATHHHTVLTKYFFCPGGVMVGSVEEVVTQLKRGIWVEH